MEREFCRKCSQCRQRSVEIATIAHEVQIDFEGRTLTVHIPDLTVPRCANCGNISFDEQASAQISRAFRKKVGLLGPREIRVQRERLGLTQANLAELLGVAPVEVDWWESGERYQPRTADQFMRAIFTVPDLAKTLAEQRAILA